MPTYQYRCPSGHEFEKFERMTVKSRPKCPECGKRSERLISGGVGLVFKGSGFYATDYKRPHRGDKTTEGGKPGKADKADKSAKPERRETPKPPSSSSSGSE
jgi:putative FmdB family regulatory protein